VSRETPFKLLILLDITKERHNFDTLLCYICHTGAFWEPVQLMRERIQCATDEEGMNEPEHKLSAEEIEELSVELAGLDRRAAITNFRRKEIKRTLRRALNNGHAEDRAFIKERRSILRQERKEAREEIEKNREEKRQDILNRMSPEARAFLQARIAGLKECTKEELREEARLAQIKKREDRAAVRRWKNGGASVE
jgi:sirohydrochlorin ferrochelatase